ncbi:MAG TPA: hypothetical protein PKO16_06955 [Bacteroidia bacterium]|nr:hypothetical protein [Bacteroidia bacterium]
MAQNQEKTINVRMEREQKDNKSVSMKLICEPSNITITYNFLSNVSQPSYNPTYLTQIPVNKL